MLGIGRREKERRAGHSSRALPPIQTVTHTLLRTMKRQREHVDASGSESASDSDSDSSQSERARMLAMLDAQCRAMTGFSGEEQQQRSEEQTQEQEEESEDGSSIQSDSDGEAGEWAGIDDKLPRAAVVVYDGSGQSTSKRTLEDLALGERDPFMVCTALLVCRLR